MIVLISDRKSRKSFARKLTYFISHFNKMAIQKGKKSLIFSSFLTILSILKVSFIMPCTMQLKDCQQLLKNTYTTSEKTDNLSQLTQSARGDKKSECINAFGGFSQIKQAISEFKKEEKALSQLEHSSAPTSNCESKLITTFRKDFSQKNNLSKLATDARSKQKNSCLQELGGYAGVSTFLKNIENNYEELPSSLPNEAQTSTTTSSPIIQNPQEETTPKDQNQNFQSLT